MSDVNRGQPPQLLQVVLLGDHATADQIDMLQELAVQHRAAVAAVFSFEPGEAGCCQELVEVDAIVTALGRALSTRRPVWLPYPREDLGQEKHFRRLCLALQRNGLDLLTGPELAPCPTTGGLSEVDFALRAEVQAVDSLYGAALAAGGVEILSREIERALAAGDSDSDSDSEGDRTLIGERRGRRQHARSEDDAGAEMQWTPLPSLPSPDAPWTQRQPVLKQFALWLRVSCGLTQTAVAQCLNPTGHRTPTGRPWQQATVSALVTGRYD